MFALEALGNYFFNKHEDRARKYIDFLKEILLVRPARVTKLLPLQLGHTSSTTLLQVRGAGPVGIKDWH